MVTVYEFDALVNADSGAGDADTLHAVPARVFDWLQEQARRLSEEEGTKWLRLVQRRGCSAVQVTSFVGVIRAPDGFQIEVLPKIGKATRGDEAPQIRQLLLDMLRCLGEFQHIQTNAAQLCAAHMPLLEVWIGEFLRAVERVVKRGLRGDYNTRQDNLFALRGKLLMAAHLRQNLCRRDRFFTQFDEFSVNRPENRLLHAALRRVLDWTRAQAHQQLARELRFVFAEVPESMQPRLDFQRVRLERDMGYYADALAWARLILNEESPLTGAGEHRAPSLLFPMEKVFEAFVARHLPRQLAPPYRLQQQASSLSLVQHEGKGWFFLKPDLLVRERKGGTNRLVLDTKWKLLDRANRAKQYGLSQADFYQLHAYGHNYLEGQGDVVLIYPKTDAFDAALPVFEFPKSSGLRLWVLPFCLQSKRLLLPEEGTECERLKAYFAQNPVAAAA